MHFSAKSQISSSKKLIFIHFEVIFFLNAYFFPGRGWLFRVSTLKGEGFNETTGSLTALKKSYSVFYTNTDCDLFDHLRPTSKSLFSTFKQKFENSLVVFLEEVFENFVSSFMRSIFKKVR